jgi:hypothetical protein
MKKAASLQKQQSSQKNPQKIISSDSRGFSRQLLYLEVFFFFSRTETPSKNLSSIIPFQHSHTNSSEDLNVKVPQPHKNVQLKFSLISMLCVCPGNNLFFSLHKYKNRFAGKKKSPMPSIYAYINPHFPNINIKPNDYKKLNFWIVKLIQLQNRLILKKQLF